MNPAEELLHLAKEQNLDIADGAFAKYLDDKDAIGHLRKQFYIPRISELLEECDVVDGPAKGNQQNVTIFKSAFPIVYLPKGWIRTRNVFTLPDSRWDRSQLKPRHWLM